MGDCIEILQWTKQYVPANKPIIYFGDELTVERVINAQRAMANESSEKWMVLMSASISFSDTQRS